MTKVKVYEYKESIINELIAIKIMMHQSTEDNLCRIEFYDRTKINRNYCGCIYQIVDNNKWMSYIRGKRKPRKECDSLKEAVDYAEKALKISIPDNILDGLEETMVFSKLI